MNVRYGDAEFEEEAYSLPMALSTAFGWFVISVATVVVATAMIAIRRLAPSRQNSRRPPTS